MRPIIFLMALFLTACGGMGDGDGPSGDSQEDQQLCEAYDCTVIDSSEPGWEDIYIHEHYESDFYDWEDDAIQYLVRFAPSEQSPFSAYYDLFDEQGEQYSAGAFGTYHGTGGASWEPPVEEQMVLEPEGDPDQFKWGVSVSEENLSWELVKISQ